jgi:hypothetical protein
MAANFRQVKNGDNLNLTLKISKMTKSRFSESQILAIMKEKEAAFLQQRLVANTESVMRNCIIGRRNLQDSAEPPHCGHFYFPPFKK